MENNTLQALLKVLSPDTIVAMGINYTDALKNTKAVDINAIMAYDEMKREYAAKTGDDLSLSVHNAIKLKKAFHTT